MGFFSYGKSLGDAPKLLSASAKTCDLGRSPSVGILAFFTAVVVFFCSCLFLWDGRCGRGASLASLVSARRGDFRYFRQWYTCSDVKEVLCLRLQPVISFAINSCCCFYTGRCMKHKNESRREWRRRLYATNLCL